MHFEIFKANVVRNYFRAFSCYRHWYIIC